MVIIRTQILSHGGQESRRHLWPPARASEVVEQVLPRLNLPDCFRGSHASEAVNGAFRDTPDGSHDRKPQWSRDGTPVTEGLLAEFQAYIGPLSNH